MPKAVRMLIRMMIIQSTALIVPHTSAAVASCLAWLDDDLACWWWPALQD